MKGSLSWSILAAGALGACVTASGPEAAGTGAADAGPSCRFAGSYGDDVLSNQGVAYIEYEDGLHVFVSGDDEDDSVHVFMHLRAGRGVFERGLVPGRYRLARDEFYDQERGLYINVAKLGSFDPDVGEYDDHSYATSGTVELSCVLPHVAARIFNLETQRDVTNDDGSVTTVPGQSVASAAFDVELTVPDVP